MTDGQHRCGWPGTDPLYVAYHDEEWGVPERDDRALFEKLILDGFQAGLSWITILRKRENFRKSFDGFDPVTISNYGEGDIARLVSDAGIIRHRGKIEATIGNAAAWRRIMEREGGFSAFLWQFTDGEPIQNAWPSWRGVPAETAESKAMSKALKKEGFRFCGPTICYAFMQAVGMVNDHETGCYRYNEVREIGKQGS
jgi:DNA-3-methyladenine glycosylase I